MKNSVQIGMNKTGLDMAPLQSKKLLDGEDDKFKSIAQAEDDPMPDLTYEDIKRMYLEESGPVGTVPPPTSIKGVATTAYQKLTAGSPEVLVDKIGERLAFERTGSRLYEALITKCETQLPPQELKFLYEICEDEKNHFKLLVDAMKEIGGDPTAVTPCADVTGVMSKGLVAVINDPRTSIAQSVNAILVAELVDNDGWDLLIKITADAGLDKLVERFEAAKENEERHLQEVRNWLQELVMANDATAVH